MPTNPDLDEGELNEFERRLDDVGAHVFSRAEIKCLLAQARRAAELSIRLHQERLAGYQDGWDEAVKAWMPETARLERENGELREALKPFAEASSEGLETYENPNFAFRLMCARVVTADFERARKALEPGR